MLSQPDARFSSHPAAHHSLSLSQQEPSFSSVPRPFPHSQRRSDEDEEDDDEFIRDDDGVLDEEKEDDDEEDLMLDSEVAAVEARHNHSDPMQQLHDLYGQEDVDWMHAGSGGFINRRGGGVGGGKRQDSYPPTAPPPSLSHRPGLPPTMDSHGPRAGKGGGLLGGGKRRGQEQKGGRRVLKQLPPIARNELPQRPSAPSPSITPPLDNEGDLDVDSSGEPVDFIDVA